MLPYRKRDRVHADDQSQQRQDAHCFHSHRDFVLLQCRQVLLFQFEISYVASLRQSPYVSGTIHRCVCDAESGDRSFRGQQLNVWSVVVKLHVESETKVAS